MRPHRLLALIAAALLTGDVARAAPVVTTGTFTLALEGVAPISFPTSGTISITGSSTIVPAGYVSLGTTLTVPVTSTTAIIPTALVITRLSNLTGTFQQRGATGLGETCPAGVSAACVTAGGVGGAMAMTGTFFLLPAGIVVIPVNLSAIGLGQGGSATALGGELFAEAAPWTTGVGQVRVPTASGNSTVSGSGSNAHLDGGPITLVTPMFVSLFGNTLPAFATLTLSQGAHAVVPEPGSLLLLGVGLLGLALLRRRR